jgi:uncharacterized protein YjbI with pentapeptide repeats
VFAVFAVFVWLGPPWLDASRLKALTPVQRETAIDALRGRMLQLGAGVAAVTALVYTARNFNLSRESHVTDRYTKAIGQLGSDALDVRLGAIYALERIMIDSPRDHPTIVEVLAAFIGEHSRLSRTRQAELEAAEETGLITSETDVRAAATVLGRRPRGREERGDLILSGAYLAGATLAGVNLIGAVLADANLTRAYLAGATLAGAYLSGANLTRANLTRANLTRANLAFVNLTRADLTSADLTSVTLAGADLTSADLTGANLTSADLSVANLTRANLTGTNLTGANLAGVELPPSALDNPTLPERFRPSPPLND